MKLKIPKKISGYLALLLLTASFGVANAVDYEGVDIPSLIPTAYKKAQSAAKEDQKAAADASSSSTSSSSEASKTAQKSMANLNDNVKHLMDSGNFGTTGLFFGPVSGDSNAEAYGALTNSVGLDKAGLQSFGANTGQKEKVEAYHAFGLALSNLQDGAKKTKPEFIGFERAVSGFENVAKAFATFGIKMVKLYNPLPVVAAFYDSSYLTNSAYTGRTDTDGNQLIRMVNGNHSLSSFIRLFGDPVTVGTVTVSRSFMITSVLIFMSFGLAAFSRLFNGQRTGITLRKSLVKFVVASIVLPLVAIHGSNLLNWVDDLRKSDTISREEYVISNNLNIYNWYKNAAFGLPSGVSLEVKNGRFQFTPEIVKAINKHASVNKMSADGTRVGISDIIGGPTTTDLTTGGLGSIGKAKTPAEKNDLALTNEIISMAKINNNRSKITFSQTYGLGDGTTGKTLPWDTTSIRTYAEALSGNQKYEPKSADVVTNDYVNVTGLTASGSGINFTYTGSASGGSYGISPIAAYNMMASTFNDNGFVVKTNTGDITTPTVAGGVITGSIPEANVRAPGIVRIVLLFSMVFVGMKSLMSIITSGFGGVFRGGMGSALGSAEGAGSLIGGVIAITLGILGLSVIITLAMDLMDIIWQFLFKLIFTPDIVKSIDEVAGDILGIFDWIPGFRQNITGPVQFAMVVFALLMMPQIVKAPIISYGEYIAGLPATFAERFKAWESAFTGDYRSPGSSIFGAKGSSSSGLGGRGGGFGSDSKNKDKERRDARINAMKTGGLMMGGTMLSLLGAKIANGHTDNNSGDVTQDSTLFAPTENVDESTAQEDTSVLGPTGEGTTSETPTETTNPAEMVEQPDAPATQESVEQPEAPATQESAGSVEQPEAPEAPATQESAESVEQQEASATQESAESVEQQEAPATQESAESVEPQEAPATQESTEGIAQQSEAPAEQSSVDGLENPGEIASEAPVESSAEQALGSVGAASIAESAIEDSDKSKQQSHADKLDDNDKKSLSPEQSNGSETSQGEASNGETGTPTSSGNGSPSGQPTTLNQTGSSSSDKQSPAKSKTGSNGKASKSSRQSKWRNAAGKGLQALGGHMAHTGEGGYKDARNMMAAGALHVVGGITGTHALTGRVAQSQIDKRNERLVKAGKDVPDKLSTVGESRRDAQARAQRNVQARDEAKRNASIQAQEEYDQAQKLRREEIEAKRQKRTGKK